MRNALTRSGIDDEPLDVLVVGAGQAGLVMGWHLSRRNLRFKIVDGAAEVGLTWRRRWDSLKLFTAAQYDDLPGMQFPARHDTYPGKDDVADFLQTYASKFELPVVLNTRVTQLRYNGFYEIDTTDGRMAAHNVVVATGPFQTPFVPPLAGELDADVFQMHSIDYRRPGSIPHGRILVVGAGNTGCQIALELSATHDVEISVGRRLPAIPQRLLGRDVWWWATRLGLTRVTSSSWLGKRLSKRDQLIGGGERELKRNRVAIRPRLCALKGRSVAFVDGTSSEYDAILWATGFRTDHSWIQIPSIKDAEGRVQHNRGVTAAPGLYVLGLTWQHTRTSALLGWVTHDAEFLAEEIGRRSTSAQHREKDAMMKTTREPAGQSHEFFPTRTEGLTPVGRPATVLLADGDTYDLRITPVRNQVNDATLRMLAYNGSIPGPTLLVKQGSSIKVMTTNDGDVEATVHWHGLRLENRYDGVPEETQDPIQVGGRYAADIYFPDAGFYWYHPHVREDFAQEMGLYGTIVVEPSDPSYWPAVDRHISITLDDLLLENGAISPFLRSGPRYTAMGRFGNVMIINGQTAFIHEITTGEVVRLYLVNTANTRIFNVGLRGLRMKLVGGDSGRYEREIFVDEVLLAPSERMIVDVLFDTAGDVALEHRAPGATETIGVFKIGGSTPPLAARTFSQLRTDPELSEIRKEIESDIRRAPDKFLAFTSSMPLLYSGTGVRGSSYSCPMHPEVTSANPEKCPKCGMKLILSEVPIPKSYVCPMHPEVTSANPEKCPKCGMKLIAADSPAVTPHAHHHGSEKNDGLEWEDLMPDINREANPSNMIWKLIDRENDAVNHAIQWRFTVGDRVKIRLANEMDGSDHPMHHPFHIHGAGRFLILSRDGVTEPNLVWKDTVLVRAGETVDILLYVTNPGLWMAHCHIAEHAESGMMFSFHVDAAAK